MRLHRYHGRVDRVHRSSEVVGVGMRALHVQVPWDDGDSMQSDTTFGVLSTVPDRGEWGKRLNPLNDELESSLIVLALLHGLVRCTRREQFRVILEAHRLVLPLVEFLYQLPVGSGDIASKLVEE